ncbi:MAG: MoaD/ThiS family protein [Exiguobacterium profundum]|nr:MAG: MoaD/ThiS family protein [Exiguobacterium profundum]
MIEVRYFAWLRERIGERAERVETRRHRGRSGGRTVGAQRGHALAFADLTSLRVALDQDMAGFDAPLAGVREVAFFPPMTGG